MKAIVITTIHDPSEAIIRFAGLKGFQLYVAGDRKTPKNWNVPNVNYLDLAQQERATRMGLMLPKNHYSRKMAGYETAIDDGAEIIIDSDDDNIPSADYHFPPFTGNFLCYEQDLGFVNPYHHFTSAKIWPRGLPLDQISRDDSKLSKVREKIRVGVWQGLANGEPDVDAIYRLTGGEPCSFENKESIVLPRGTMAPFNSQNTAFVRALFPLLYLPAHVTFRFTDILRGLVAQPIMWKHGFHVGFSAASVVQERNPHDCFQDFLSEIPMYRHCRTVVDIASTASAGQSLVDDLWSTYEGLFREGIVESEELEMLQTWLELFRN